MKRYPRLHLMVPAVLVGLCALPAHPAFAERKNPLEGQPAVRNRLLLVKHRFEAALAFESSINPDYRHTLAGGLKLEFHLSDMLSIGGVGLFGTSFNTGFTSNVIDSLPDDSPDTEPEPTKTEFEEHLNSIPLHGAAYASLTPWYGKLAAFGNFFVNFDFYFQGGLAFAQLDNDCCSFPVDSHPGEPLIEGGMVVEPPDNNPRNDDPLNDGFRMGIYLGGGLHVFLNNWLALDLSIRDYLFRDNPSGADFIADGAVLDSCPEGVQRDKCNDSRFLSHFFVGIGLSFFLPPTPSRTP